MMSKQCNLTVKGQVTIPKDVRDALGLKAGDPVAFEFDGDRAVLRKGKRDEAEYQRRLSAATADIERVRKRFAHWQTGRSTDDIMRELRGDEPLP